MGTQREYSSNLMGVYFDVLHEIATSGMTFKDKSAPYGKRVCVGKGSIPSVRILPGIKTLLGSQFWRRSLHYCYIMGKDIWCIMTSITM